jgi:hypothetical protein
MSVLDELALALDEDGSKAWPRCGLHTDGKWV